MQCLCSDGESWGMDDEVISRLVEDAIDSESREVLTMSRSRSVYTTWSIVQSRLESAKSTAELAFFVLFLLLSDKTGYADVTTLEVE